MLLPSEKEAMLKQLEDAKVPLKPLKINPSKTQPVSPALQALLSKNNDLKVRHAYNRDSPLRMRDRCCLLHVYCICIPWYTVPRKFTSWKASVGNVFLIAVTALEASWMPA